MKNMTRKMERHESGAHDGKHERNATGDMAAVKRVTHGRTVVGGEQCGGRQGSKGLSGADPNKE